MAISSAEHCPPRMAREAHVDATVRGRAIYVFDPDEFDIETMAEEMREADRLEIERYSGRDPAEVMREAVEHSAICRVGYVDGELAAVWGVVSWGALSGGGSPWCFTTPVVETCPRVFLRLSKFYADLFVSVCGELAVYVDGEYQEACSWLRRIGFSLAPVMHRGHPFYLARRVRDV